MSRLTESAIEDFAIKLFERLSYSYVYAPDIAPDGESPERSHYDEVLLSGRLAQALKRINPRLSPAPIWLPARHAITGHRNGFEASRDDCWRAGGLATNRKRAASFNHEDLR